MSSLKEKYQQQHAPAGLAIRLENEYARRARPVRWAGAAAMAGVLLAVVAFFAVAPDRQWGEPTERLAAADETPLTPAALTARTSELGQLSTTRLSLPSSTNLAGVTSVPALPKAPALPATL